MSVTINAHQLGRLIDKTIDHIGDEGIEALHGIRFDADARYLHTVASDRYTLATARYQLNHDDTKQEPWARTLPANYLPALRTWLSSHKGAAWITVDTSEDRLVFSSPQATYSVTVNLGLEFPEWRGVLRTIAAATTEGEPFPALNARLLARFGATEDILRLRVTSDRQAALLVGEDFMAAMMPSRFTGVGPVKEETLASVRDLWQWTLAAGERGVDMETAIPKPARADGTSDGAPRTVPATAEELLREVLNSTWDLRDADYYGDNKLWFAYIRVSVANWAAYRYLDALYQADPRAAREAVESTADQLDSGEIGEWAWDMAKQAGHDPEQWDVERANALAKRKAKKAPDWAERLAQGLNAAKAAGIGFRVEDNPHVAFDEQTEQWSAVPPVAVETA